MAKKSKIVNIKITGETKSQVDWWRHFKGMVFTVREEYLVDATVAVLLDETTKLIDEAYQRNPKRGGWMGTIGSRNYKVTTAKASTAEELRKAIPKEVMKPKITIEEIFAKMAKEQKEKEQKEAEAKKLLKSKRKDAK